MARSDDSGFSTKKGTLRCDQRAFDGAVAGRGDAHPSRVDPLGLEQGGDALEGAAAVARRLCPRRLEAPGRVGDHLDVRFAGQHLQVAGGEPARADHGDPEAAHRAPAASVPSSTCSASPGRSSSSANASAAASKVNVCVISGTRSRTERACRSITVAARRGLSQR